MGEHGPSAGPVGHVQVAPSSKRAEEYTSARTQSGREHGEQPERERSGGKHRAIPSCSCFGPARVSKHGRELEPEGTTSDIRRWCIVWRGQDGVKPSPHARPLQPIHSGAGVIQRETSHQPTGEKPIHPRWRQPAGEKPFATSSRALPATPSTSRLLAGRCGSAHRQRRWQHRPSSPATSPSCRRRRLSSLAACSQGHRAITVKKSWGSK
jgi:hypothetical protein